MTRTFYEIYDKRVLHQDTLEGLPLLARCTWINAAHKEAAAWGACIVKVRATVVQVYPLIRKVESWQVIHIHRPPQKRRPVREVTHRVLMGKIRQHEKSPHPIIWKR